MNHMAGRAMALRHPEQVFAPSRVALGGGDLLRGLPPLANESPRNYKAGRQLNVDAHIGDWAANGGAVG